MLSSRQRIPNPRQYLFGGRAELRKAATKRWVDAEALQEKARWRGAMYLAGYSLECKLKARLLDHYSLTHLDDLDRKLARKAGESGLRKHDLGVLMKRLSIPVSNVCKRWNSQWRYDPQDGDKRSCGEFMKAIKTVIDRLD